MRSLGLLVLASTSVLLLGLLACGGAGAQPRDPGAAALRVLTGRASYYADSLAGNRTANGETYDPRAFTAASRDLPF
ncbi:MAG: septal ring lytic transglycosylase RlpA family protein, partial [Myxococcota bacterium]